MRRLIALLLLLTFAFSLCACDVSMIQNLLSGTTEGTTPGEEQTTPDSTTPDETTPEVTTPEAPETPVTPDSVGFRVLAATRDTYSFCAIISSENKNAYIDLESFFNEVLAPSLFGDITYEETLADVNWFVDGEPAEADTKVFNNSTVSFMANDERPQPPFDETVKIVFYHTMGESLRVVLDKYIAEFNELYPNIIIEHKQIGGYDDVRDQIQTEITVGDQPNIAYCYPDHVALYNMANAVQSLDELINLSEIITRADGTTETVGLTQEQIDNFIDGFYEEGRAFGDGLMYTMPMSKSTELLYYNKTFFEEHNLTVPATWDEMEVLCEYIKQIDPNCIPLCYDSEANWFITMCEQFNSPYTSATGDHFLFDNEVNHAFAARLRSWFEKGYIATTEIIGGYSSNLFSQKHCYMSIASSAGAKYQNNNGRCDFEVGVASIPQVDPSAPKVISQGPSLCIFKDSNSEEVIASWLFVKFLTTNTDFQAEFSLESGYMPVLESVVDHPVYREILSMANGYENLPLLAAKVALEQADAYFTSPAFYGSAQAREEVGRLLLMCLTDSSCATMEGIKSAFAEAVRECNYQIIGW